jgi:hypothetical protein
MYQQLWGYKVEEKLYLGVREQKRLNTTDLDNYMETVTWDSLNLEKIYIVDLYVFKFTGCYKKNKYLIKYLQRFPNFFFPDWKILL